MQNTQENFPNVPVTELSNWTVVRKSDGAKFDVIGRQFNGETSTDVSFDEEGTERTISFTPGVGQQLQNEEYAVVFTHGGDPVVEKRNATKASIKALIDHNGTIVTE
jgi:hypothetical protein